MLKAQLTCEQLVNDAMVCLVLDFPVYAQLITRIGVKIVDEKDKQYCGWTDGTAIYLNKYFIERNNRYPIRKYRDPITGEEKTVDVTMGAKEIVFLLAHELSHLIYSSYDRCKNVNLDCDPHNPVNNTYEGKQRLKLWNCATDYEINSILHNNESNNQPKPIGRMPEMVLYDSKYRNKIAEEIFKELEAEQQQNQQNQQQQQSGGSDSSSGNGNGQGGDDGDQNDDSTPPSFSDEDQVPEYVDASFDKHMPIKDTNTKNDIIAKIADVIGNTTQDTGSSALNRILQQTFKPEPFNWRQALTKYIRGWMKDNYTWNKPSRAGVANNIILPSQSRTPKMHIAVAIDTSGSVGENELQTLLNHLFTILQIYRDFQVDVWCVSTCVHEETFKTFTAQNKSDLKTYQIASNGGTNLSTCFSFINKKYKTKKPDAFILMSDFYDRLDGNTSLRVSYPCIWFVMDHKDFTPPSKVKASTYHITLVDGKM